MKVTSENYPSIHKAFDLILEEGREFNHEDEYEVPEPWASRLQEVDDLLESLIDHEGEDMFEEVCVGEQFYIDRFLDMAPIYRPAVDFLTAFFADWEDDHAKT